MAVARHHLIDRKFLDAVRDMTPPSGDLRPAPVRPERLLDLFETQITSRHLDIEAREMKGRNEGYYTIGSSGHEANAAVAAALRPTDPCFLHYRSGAFMVQRAKQLPGTTPIFDTLLSLAASSQDPASGGRHKVWGSVPLWVPPQTSTIASHLPKAMGAAFAIERAVVVDHDLPVPNDSIAVATLGDASINHSTTLGAINAALWARHKGIPMPLLVVCEDNGTGISVRTPNDWIERQWGSRDGLAYFRADGLDLEDSYLQAMAAVRTCRSRRVPVLLHMKVVRLGGHAGSDVETTYREEEEIAAVEARDPLIASARKVVERGLMRPDEIVAVYEETRDRVQAASREASRRPKLVSVEAVVESLAPFDEQAVADETARTVTAKDRVAHFGSRARLPEASKRRRPMKFHLNWALHDLMLKYPEMLAFGEDVGNKGGVYNVTDKLCEKFGRGRVFDTLLDEQSILGAAMGAAQLGYLPCPEIQYLAYLVHASDQLRGEACSLQFFSNGGFANPMVIRVAGLAYQKGFGGHFHNDNGFAFLREIPGLILAVPSRGDDAAAMLRTCFAVAKASGRVVVFLEPIALYATRHVDEAAEDDAWLFDYPAPDVAAPFGEPRVDTTGRSPKLTIITYGNGVVMSHRAVKRMAKDGIHAHIVDLRWLMPLNREAVVREARRTGRVLVVDEGRRTAGIGEEIIAVLNEEGPDGLVVDRVASRDSYVPLAAAANLVLLQDEEIERHARGLLEWDPAPEALA